MLRTICLLLTFASCLGKKLFRGGNELGNKLGAGGCTQSLCKMYAMMQLPSKFSQTTASTATATVKASQFRKNYCMETWSFTVSSKQGQFENIDTLNVVCSRSQTPGFGVFTHTACASCDCDASDKSEQTNEQEQAFFSFYLDKSEQTEEQKQGSLDQLGNKLEAKDIKRKKDRKAAGCKEFTWEDVLALPGADVESLQYADESEKKFRLELMNGGAVDYMHNPDFHNNRESVKLLSNGAMDNGEEAKVEAEMCIPTFLQCKKPAEDVNQKHDQSSSKD